MLKPVTLFFLSTAVAVYGFYFVVQSFDSIADRGLSFDHRGRFGSHLSGGEVILVPVIATGLSLFLGYGLWDDWRMGRKKRGERKKKVLYEEDSNKNH